MGSPTVPWGLQPGSYEISGDVRSGIHARADFKVKWSDAITFCNDILVSPKATHIGLITWNAPWRLPVSFGGATSPVYAQSFTIRPQGASTSPGPNQGLAPGEFYTDAIITVQFDSVQSTQTWPADDPNSLNQLDPANPITACEQSVDINGKMVTMDGNHWVYMSGTYGGKPVTGEFSVNRNEVKLVTAFPRVPYLPWETVQPYIGKVNQGAILGCAKGSLMLEGMGTKITSMTDGTIGQSVTLKWAFNPDWTGNSPNGLDWNSVDFPDGSGTSVVISATGGLNPYKYMDFSQIFNDLEF